MCNISLIPLDVINQEIYEYLHDTKDKLIYLSLNKIFYDNQKRKNIKKSICCNSLHNKLKFPNNPICSTRYEFLEYMSTILHIEDLLEIFSYICNHLFKKYNLSSYEDISKSFYKYKYGKYISQSYMINHSSNTNILNRNVYIYKNRHIKVDCVYRNTIFRMRRLGIHKSLTVKALIY